MLQIDYLVIGAGIAGLSAASRLARHGRTVVCEAEAAPGVHASGRSAAFAHFDMDSALVRALTAASIPLLEEPNARRHSALFVALEQQDQTLDRLAYHYSEWSSQARRLSVSEARELVPVLREDRICGALLDENGRKLDAHSMLETHRKALIKNGGSIACGAPVTGMQHDGTRWIVDTPGTSYAAKAVVNAAGAWVDEIAGLAQVKPIGIHPLRRTVITFDVPIDVSAWPFTKTVGPGFYIEPEGAGRLLACPMDEGTSAPCDAQPEDGMSPAPPGKSSKRPPLRSRAWRANGPVCAALRPTVCPSPASTATHRISSGSPARAASDCRLPPPWPWLQRHWSPAAHGLANCAP